MVGKLKLTVACGDYEIVRALKEGAVEADGLDLVMLTGMGPRERHWRMARRAEFDVCEANVGAYFMERDHGAPLTAIPVFLHRRFRHGFLFVNAAAGIRAPKDLIGKKVGGTNFQAPSYSPITGWLYLAYQESGQAFISAPAPFEAGRQYIGRGRGATPTPRPNDPPPSAGITYGFRKVASRVSASGKSRTGPSGTHER